jgi:hypothetical protein
MSQRGNRDRKRRPRTRVKGHAKKRVYQRSSDLSLRSAASVVAPHFSGEKLTVSDHEVVHAWLEKVVEVAKDAQRTRFVATELQPRESLWEAFGIQPEVVAAFRQRPQDDKHNIIVAPVVLKTGVASEQATAVDWRSRFTGFL